MQGERAARFHAKTIEALNDMVAAAGLKHPKDLQPHHLMHRVGPESALPLDQIHPFFPKDILTQAPEDTIYSDWWAAARAESFRPATDLVARRATSNKPAKAS